MSEHDDVAEANPGVVEGMMHRMRELAEEYVLLIFVIAYVGERLIEMPGQLYARTRK